MHTTKSKSVPGALTRARRKLDRWRQERNGHRKLPEALWALSVELAGQYGVSETAAALNHGKLQAAPLKTLPAVGYLEQTVADAIGAALTKIGVDKPKFPLLDSTSSALLALALQLRATNPNGGTAAEKAKLAQFEDECQFVTRALDDMENGVTELEALREKVQQVVSEYR